MDVPLKILLVEDDEADRTMVRRALGASGVPAEFAEARDAASALRALRSEQYDCALVDFRLPDADGLSILQDIRVAGITTPIVMLIDEGDQPLAVDMMKAGATDYLSKARLAGDLVGHTVRHAVGLHRAEQRYRFMAEASELLASSLDYEATLTSMARLAVPKIADWCAIDMLDEQGEIRRLAVFHSQPAKLAFADQLQWQYPPRREDPRSLYNILKDGESRLLPDIPDAFIDSIARDAGHAAVLRALGLKSAMIVPLMVRGRALGAITLVNAESDHRYGARDLALAEDLARRAATAVDNARLYRELKEAKDAAEAANAAKDQFLAVLSHEMRTPLTPVLSTVQALESDPDLAAPMRASIDMIRRNVELEARLIDDLLDLTRIARGKLEFNVQTIDAQQCLRSAIDICVDELRGKGQQLMLELNAEEQFVRADGARVQQVFWNLIKNAIKFTPEGGTIRVRSTNLPVGRLRIEVRDTGIGIEPHLLPRIFDAFEQGERSVTRRFGGLGLGLAISKALMEMQGGSLIAKSEGRNRGATFIVDLPITSSPPAHPAGGAGSNGDEHDRPLRILVVDDHEDTARAMRRLLERSGHSITIASDVQQALDAFNKGEFDLVISDIGLPDGSGLELMRRLRRMRDVPGIALSGFGMDEDIRKSIEAGFAEHLTKPINLQRLASVIRRVTQTV